MEETLIEKYRPKKLDDMVFGNKLMIRNILKNPFKMQHILLYSTTPGTGKTTLGKIIINELHADKIFINSSKDRTLEVIRDRVTKFAGNKSSNPNAPKIILLDEVDGMAKLTQDALRAVMEENAQNCKFILTCNNINKVSDAVKSRCVKIPIKQHSKKDIKDRLLKIIEAEHITISDEKIEEFIEKHHPSIRDCIQELQVYQLTDGKDQYIIPSREIWEMIKSKKYMEVRKKIFEDGIDIEDLVQELWFLFIKDDIKNKKEIVMEFAKLDYNLKIGATPEIQLTNFCAEMEKWV